MKKTKARQILLLAAVILFAQSSCFADPIGGFNPSDIPTNMNYGGIINSHDMMMLKEKQRLQDEAKDFQNFQDRKQGKHKKDEVIKDETGSGEKIYDAETSQKKDSVSSNANPKIIRKNRYRNNQPATPQKILRRRMTAKKKL